MVNEVNGTWRKAIPAPGAAALNKDDDASLMTVSCATAGNCAAGGVYSPGGNQGFPTSQAFVIDETQGVWGKPWRFPAPAP